jgi:hypothetical protein
MIGFHTRGVEQPERLSKEELANHICLYQSNREQIEEFFSNLKWGLKLPRVRGKLVVCWYVALAPLA